MIKFDCRYFIGSKPCRFNKTKGQECPDCPFYSPVQERILIIKLDAIGDVLRTTCITPKVKERHPNSYVVWITRKDSRELLMANPHIDEVWLYNVDTLSYLHVLEWDYIYNPSNDHISATLATLARARKQKIGFLLSNDGTLLPTNDMARLWLEMAAFDSVKKANKVSFQEILYGICGFSGPIDYPQLSLPEFLKTWASSLINMWAGQSGTIIGVNTGAGNRWPKKMPKTEKMITIILDILKTFPQSQVLLLGGPEEFNRNRKIKAVVSSSRVHDAGCGHSLLEFAALISCCHVLLCGDTLALHIACALKIPVVALFGPTSMAEIYSYNGLVEKISANSLDCLCCYSHCDKDEDCMTAISNDKILEKLARQICP